jgi:hypothetical protein
VVQFQAVLVAFQEVAVSFLEHGVLEAEFGQEEVVPIDAFVIDLYVLVYLDGVPGVLDRLIVEGQFALAYRQVDQCID